MKHVPFSESTERGVEINLSPLIDCVFLLLIFFIVTTQFVQETGVAIEKPRAVSAEEVERNSILIVISADGRILFAGQEIGLNGVRGVVARQLREREIPVVILADAEVRTAPLVELIDVCKLAGARQVSLAASREFHRP